MGLITTSTVLVLSGEARTGPGIPSGARTTHQQGFLRPGPRLDTARRRRLVFVGAAEVDPVRTPTQPGGKVIDGTELVGQLRRADLAHQNIAVPIIGYAEELGAVVRAIGALPRWVGTSRVIG